MTESAIHRGSSLWQEVCYGKPHESLDRHHSERDGETHSADAVIVFVGRAHVPFPWNVLTGHGREVG